MARKIGQGRKRGRHFFKEWRQFRHLTQEQLAGRLDISKASISRLESGDQPYSQELLEWMAEALACEPADLLMRNPQDPEAPWSIWEALAPEQRKQAIRLLKALMDEEAA